MYKKGKASTSSGLKNKQLVLVKKVEKDEDNKVALVKKHDEMSLIDIINDRSSGVVAPSEALRRKKMLEEKSAMKDKRLEKVDDTVSEAFNKS